jgi:signal transduction histidine kinase/CheY-like chemotaxis protein
MSPPDHPDEEPRRLQHCIRDLVTLTALPSMCVGLSFDDTLRVAMEALPTALSCALVYLELPATSDRRPRAVLRGKALEHTEVAALRKALEPHRDDSHPVALSNGSTLWCSAVSVPIGSAQGWLVAGSASEPHPETDRVLLRTAANLVGTALAAAMVLQEAQGKDDFLARLGHELRNPLAPILIAVELLKRHPQAAREQDVLERQTRHLARLVDDLLDISRVTRGHVELRSELVALSVVLGRAVEMVAHAVSRSRHELRVDDARDVMLRGDPVRLVQIFGNLLSNAAKFTPPGGQIGVTVEVLDGRVRVTVRDDGRGIVAENLETVFEPFVQLDRRDDSLRGGLGLGLAIVHDLVQRHGGSIAAKSEGLGRGAAFVVELPTVREVPQSLPPGPPKGAHNRALRVLVVDDNVDVATLLSQALEIEGYETAVEHDALHALERWRRFSPHAAVLDVGLPERDGYELAKALRAEHGEAPLLIAATGYGQGRDRARAMDAGFDCHFVKPVSLHDLLSVLDRRAATATP